MFKIGLTTYISFGSYLTSSLSARRPVFLDLKLHDIPAQVEGAVAAVAATGASLVTIHAAGGADMVRAATDAAGEVTVLAVTILTSLDDGALTAIGIDGSTGDAVLRLAELAVANGVGGLVCSPLEVAALRARFGSLADGGPLLVVPGIRPHGSDAGDQRRTMGPREALDAGADVLVIGRPITAAPDPGVAAADIALGIRAS
jgi:orotidine-5'-phosphate decarboxylase